MNSSRSSIAFKRLTTSVNRLSDLSIDTLYSDIPLPPATQLKGRSFATSSKDDENDHGMDAMQRDVPVLPKTRFEMSSALHKTLLEDAMMESKGIISSSRFGSESFAEVLQEDTLFRTTTARQNEVNSWKQWRKYAPEKSNGSEEIQSSDL